MIGQFPLDEQIHIDNLTQHWDRFMSAADDREQALHAEIARLQRLQRLAEKVHKDTKLFEGYLDDVEQKLNEVCLRYLLVVIDSVDAVGRSSWFPSWLA